MTEKASISHSVQGSWRGWYTYMGKTERHGFEAVFLESGSQLVGNILDDGKLGEADVSGNFGFPAIKFTKSYRNPGFLPVKYQGIMANDGKSMSGYWSLKGERGSIVGQWSAVRSDDEQFKFDETERLQDLEQETEQKKLLLIPMSDKGR